MYVHTLVGMEAHANGRLTPSTYNADQLSLWPLHEGFNAAYASVSQVPTQELYAGA
jgi:hypothetical protein